MSKKVYLILENHDVFEGFSFGEEKEVTGEVVFTTSMTGYLETLTDKSYYGQIIVQAFPLIGNYGVIPQDFESNKINAVGYIVNDWCRSPSNFRCEDTIDAFLKSHHIPGVYGIDTRKLIKTIREYGAMNGKISFSNEFDNAITDYHVTSAVESVSVNKVTEIKAPENKYNVAVFDFGYKENITRELLKRGCNLTIFPYDTKACDIIKMKPDGIMLTNGPGDPSDNKGVIKELSTLVNENIPIFGICLGHQLLALAHGFKTEKLKFGHRGANHPAKNLQSGRTYITSQNHGYAVNQASINKNIAEELFINVNDNTNEGIMYKNKNIFSVQFHPEGCGGPQDTNFLFDEFITRMEDNKNAKK